MQARAEGEGRGKRERYLTLDEEVSLTKALTGEFDYLRPAVEVSLGTGLRKSELIGLKVEHVNFGSVPIFYPVNGRDVEVLPNWLLVVKSKNRKPRVVPMNRRVRAALLEVIQDAPGSECVFSYARTAVSGATIRRGFEKACKQAEITQGQTKRGGLTWHDLRHTFAARLRAEGVHAFDIMQLLGHSSVGMRAGYAHGTNSVMQTAVDKLAAPRGEVVSFERKAG